MISQKRYNLLVGLFPVIYLIHNAEEWIVFSRTIDSIARLSPSFIKNVIVQNPSSVETVFGIGLIFATLLPLIVTLAILGKPTGFNFKILIIIAFATLINAVSHVSSSLALGIIGPGLITGILLCIPYSLIIVVQVQKGNRFTFREYSLFGLLSVVVYLLAIALSWIIGFGVFRFLS